ncbi:hypothetical protein FG379_000346 [Cryptosporidium bovis]|uniref:uncharacterized protein n=1 Tax=Cryptosporidium bovis TaxID=310047 RepID=UPI00351A9F7D|nr:hypothetical protein FG379_000346 [Cryptosporidium bovis]
MDKKEPIELISQIKAIFYFIGGSYIHFNDDEEEHDISVIKVNIKDCNTKEDCVTLPLIEERINNIQGVDYNLKLIISKVLPVSINGLNAII